MCIQSQVCPIYGRKGKRAKPTWYEWTRKYFNILHQCVNQRCKNFGQTFIYEHFNWHYPDHHRTTHCEEHGVTAEVIEARRKGLTVEGKAECPVDKKIWSFEIRLFRGC